MKKISLLKRCSVRFRRWSRKGYAVFVSLHRAVTIGHVCRSIMDAALSKNKSFSTANRKQALAWIGTEAMEEVPDDEGGGIFVSASQGWKSVSLLCLVQMAVQVLGKVASCPERLYTLLYIIVGGMGKTRKRVSLIPLFCLKTE